MSLLEHRVDACQTGAAAISAAAAVLTWRRKMYGRHEKKYCWRTFATIPEKQPEMIICAALGEIELFDPIVPNFVFSGDGLKLFQSVKDDLKIDLTPNITIKKIVEAVCREFGLPASHVISDRRTAYYMPARKLIYALACHLTTLSLPIIGRTLGGRDHTTILNGARKMDPLIEAVVAQIEPDATLARWAELAHELYPDVFGKPA